MIEEFFCKSIGTAVVGAGHAGIEAALASARMGVETVLFTLSLDAVGNMPCNPSIGGTGKGHLVCEIDALGGEMGRAADTVCLQSRMLNLAKGPAVHSLRQQADRRAYHRYMKNVLENTKNLDLIQAEITKIRPKGELWELVTKFGAVYEARAVIVCSGTYLRANIVVGDCFYSAGPDNLFPANELTDSLKELGISFMRFKTGTPARIHADSIDYSQCEIQPGDVPPVPFSYYTDKERFKNIPQLSCYTVYTNEETHRIIRENIHRSPLYSGKIKSTGPRYCPSIEDKVMRFADKSRHQLFLEPMGLDTKEVYVQGLSSSLPEDVQFKVLHSIKGLENAKVMRTAYAIEYDCIDPTQLYATMEFKNHRGLYGAGQFNGTSGYEEAAAQGIVAGINAAFYQLGKEPMILDRASSYIGTLIDDLVTKGTEEPYRMMTSRCEYRLLLRQDNADRRLIGHGRRAGLIDDERYAKKQELFALIDQEIQRMESTFLPPSKRLNEILAENSSSPVDCGMRLSELIRRPELDAAKLAPVDVTRPELDSEVIERAQIEVKYQGYIKRQQQEARAFKKLEEKLIPDTVCYKDVKGLRIEAAQKLEKLRPRSIGQASRISGVSPADITVLLIYLNIV
ncbi:MAG: tRNA uridine-5-carboxymethylaminomethyl(34) synthesis enzyme MnmG [Ruminococcaceae bacterium]|nr:tRNA uridine-5-carboxymethylaminomethyl(34) synthesis enzyme MnmG [Oscillospiraceae bacterium]